MKDNLPNRMLQLMSDGAWHSKEELVDRTSHRFSATMHTLKKQGYCFERRHIKGQQYEYRLIISTQEAIA
ncbi:MAG: hypothetical protein AAFW75_09505 [Cyanobacteria bacterium J06636_16]